MVVLLYDYKRDGEIKPGEALLVYENEKTRRVSESSLYKKEEFSVRPESRVKKTSAVRSRITRTVQRRKATARRAPPAKRTALYKS